jgi:hypothetical protein
MNLQKRNQKNVSEIENEKSKFSQYQRFFQFLITWPLIENEKQTNKQINVRYRWGKKKSHMTKINALAPSFCSHPALSGLLRSTNGG